MNNQNESVSFGESAERETVKRTIDRVYRMGLTTTSGGNISMMDGDGAIYITPSGIDKGTLKTDDLSKVLPNGKRVGKYAPSMELPFHGNIYRIRADIRGIVHAHAPAVVAYACMHKAPDSSIARCYRDSLGTVGTSRYDLPGSTKLGDIVTEEFRKGYRAVMMDNHGATVGACDLDTAYRKYETLDFLCQTAINARILGGAHVVDKPVDLPVIACKILPAAPSVQEEEVREQLAAFIRRSYDNKLMGSEWGTLAVRFGDGFLVNPDSCDRGLVRAADLVLYREGTLSADREIAYLGLIDLIFQTRKEAECVFLSMPSALMGFAAAHVRFDARLIPESYIMLREVSRLPYEAIATPQSVADTLTTDTPAVVIDNECAITIGKNILKAFDRMEVMDYSARSVIAAKNIAQIVAINDDQVAEINDTFNGW